MSETLHGRAGECQRAHDGVRPFSEGAGAHPITPPSRQTSIEGGEEGFAPGTVDPDELARLTAQRELSSLFQARAGTANPYNRPRNEKAQSASPGVTRAFDDSMLSQIEQAASQLRAARSAKPVAPATIDLKQTGDARGLVPHEPRPRSLGFTSEATAAAAAPNGTHVPAIEARSISAPKSRALSDTGIEQASNGPAERARSSRGTDAPPSGRSVSAAAGARQRAEQRPAARPTDSAAGSSETDAIQPERKASCEDEDEDPNAWRAQYEQPVEHKQARRWKPNRHERRISASVARAEERQTFAYDWMTADDLSRSSEELDDIEARRTRLEATVTRADGSLPREIEGVFSRRDQQTIRNIRDHQLFAACEWGKIWRTDRMLANLTLAAAWCIREDGTATAVRDWYSQRARNMLAIIWMLHRIGKGARRRRELGFLIVRGISIEYLQHMLATEGKEKLHRNTLSGVHRSGSPRNEDLGYLRVLELGGVIECEQYGDRAKAPRELNEYRLRVSLVSEGEQLLGREELMLRAFARNRWQRLADVSVIFVCSWRRAAALCSDPELLASIRAELSVGADPPS